MYANVNRATLPPRPDGSRVRAGGGQECFVCNASPFDGFRGGAWLTARWINQRIDHRHASMAAMRDAIGRTLADFRLHASRRADGGARARRLEPQKRVYESPSRPIGAGNAREPHASRSHGRGEILFGIAVSRPVPDRAGHVICPRQTLCRTAELVRIASMAEAMAGISRAQPEGPVSPAPRPVSRA